MRVLPAILAIASAIPRLCLATQSPAKPVVLIPRELADLNSVLKTVPDEDRARLEPIARLIGLRLSQAAQELRGVRVGLELNSPYRIMDPTLLLDAGRGASYRLVCGFVYPGGPPNAYRNSQPMHPLSSCPPGLNANHVVNTLWNETVLHYERGPYGYFEVIGIESPGDDPEFPLWLRQKGSVGLHESWTGNYRLVRIKEKRGDRPRMATSTEDLYLEVVELPAEPQEIGLEYRALFKPAYPIETGELRKRLGKVAATNSQRPLYALVVEFEPVHPSDARYPDFQRATGVAGP